MSIYQRSNFIYTKIDPSKKFRSFSYTEVSSNEEYIFAISTSEVYKFGNDYFYYKREHKYLTSNPDSKSKIQFKAGKKIIKEFNA